MPPRANSTTPSRMKPEEELPALGQAAEHEFEQHEERSRRRPARTAGPVPPRMISTISSPDICHDSMDGLTKRLRSAKSAPAMPVIMAEMHEGDKPDAETARCRRRRRGISFCRAACSAAPKRESRSAPRKRQRRHQQRVADEEETQRIGVLMPGSRCARRSTARPRRHRPARRWRNSRSSARRPA